MSMNNETIPQFGAVRYPTGQDTWFSANPGDKDYACALSLATEYYEGEWLPVGNLQGIVSQQQYLEFCLLYYKSKSELRFGQSFYLHFDLRLHRHKSRNDFDNLFNAADEEAKRIISKLFNVY